MIDIALLKHLDRTHTTLAHHRAGGGVLMEREEIVKALRGECDDCSGLSDDGCRCDLPIYCPNRDAADLIEQQATRIAELEECKAAAFMMVRNNILPIGKNYGKTDLEIDVMTIETLNKMREMLKMADAIALMRAAEAALKEQEAGK